VCRCCAVRLLLVELIINASHCRLNDIAQTAPMHAWNAAGSPINLCHEEQQSPSSLPRPLPRQSQPTLQEHAKKRHLCPGAGKYQCSERFTTSGHAQRHLKKHTGQKTHFCRSCKQSFARADNLRQHQQTDRHHRSHQSQHVPLAHRTVQ
jgi:hypothetical protein